MSIQATMLIAIAVASAEDKTPPIKQIINDLRTLVTRIDTLHLKYTESYNQEIDPRSIIGYRYKKPSTRLEKLRVRLFEKIKKEHAARNEVVVMNVDWKKDSFASVVDMHMETRHADGTKTLSDPRQMYYSRDTATYLNPESRYATITKDPSTQYAGFAFRNAIGIAIEGAPSYSLADLLSDSADTVEVRPSEAIEGMNAVEVTISRPLPKRAQEVLGSEFYLKLWLAEDHFFIPIQWQIWNVRSGQIQLFCRNSEFTQVRDEARGQDMFLPHRYQYGTDPGLSSDVSISMMRVNVKFERGTFAPVIPKGWVVTRDGVAKNTVLKGGTDDWEERVSQSVTKAESLLRENRGEVSAPSSLPRRLWLYLMLGSIGLLVALVVIVCSRGNSRRPLS